MACAGIDTAIRGLVALGIHPDAIAILDNFCWCSSDEPERLGQLKRAAFGCYDTAKAFGTPFISGKDSMFNDFSGFDADNNPVKVSVPPTLLISSIGILGDVSKAVSMDAKFPGISYTLSEGPQRSWGIGILRPSRFCRQPLCRPSTRSWPGHGTCGSPTRSPTILWPPHSRSATGGSGSHSPRLPLLEISGWTSPSLRKCAPITSSSRNRSAGSLLRSILPTNGRSSCAIGPDAHLLGRTGGNRLRITGKNLLVDTGIGELETAYKAPFRGY